MIEGSKILVQAASAQHRSPSRFVVCLVMDNCLMPTNSGNSLSRINIPFILVRLSDKLQVSPEHKIAKDQPVCDFVDHVIYPGRSLHPIRMKPYTMNDESDEVSQLHDTDILLELILCARCNSTTIVACY